MIPKKIFTIWLNDDTLLPPQVAACVATHKIEGYEHRMITLENVYRGSRYVRECLEAKKWAKAADFLRMHYLFTEGGIYLDADMEVLAGKNFDDLLNFSMFVSKDVEDRYWANSGLGSIAGHPVLKEYLRRVEDNFLGGGDSVFEPGIRTFTDVLWESGVERMGIKVISNDNFFPYNHITSETKITENTRAIHHYHKSWLKK